MRQNLPKGDFFLLNLYFNEFFAVHFRTNGSQKNGRGSQSIWILIELFWYFDDGRDKFPFLGGKRLYSTYNILSSLLVLQVSGPVKVLCEHVLCHVDA